MPSRIGYLKLTKDHPIDNSTYLKFKLSIDHFKEQKVGQIVVELDTPGGEVFAALKIADLLKEVQTRDQIPVMAYLNNWAISAGAMLAYSCKTIGISPGASMGAAEPVMQTTTETAPASEKVNSALRAEFANLATFWGRNPLLAEAMVDKDLILVLRQGEIVKLDDESQMKLGSDQVITRKGKLLTLNAQQLKEFHIAAFETSSLFQTPAFQGKEIVTYNHWKIDFYSFLSNPFIAGLLGFGLLIGIYLEMQHPGLIAPLILAGSCLGLILLSQFAVETVYLLELIALGAGIVILFVELFILPTFGIGGIVGLLLALGGFISIMIPHFHDVQFFPALNLAAEAIIERLAYLCGWMLVAGCLFAWILPRYLRRFAHTHHHEHPLPFVIAEGKQGMAYTQLRPSGKVVIDGTHYEATTEGRFVEKGTAVAVIRQEGNKLWVKSV